MALSICPEGEAHTLPCTLTPVCCLYVSPHPASGRAHLGGHQRDNEREVGHLSPSTGSALARGSIPAAARQACRVFVPWRQSALQRCGRERDARCQAELLVV